MATLSRQSIGLAGTAITFAAASAGGDKAAPAEGVKLLVKNDSGSSMNVIVGTPATVQGLAVEDRTVAVAAGTIKAIPLSQALYGNKADSGLASWTYSATASVTVAVII